MRTDFAFELSCTDGQSVANAAAESDFSGGKFPPKTSDVLNRLFYKMDMSAKSKWDHVLCQVNARCSVKSF